ncbi:hypothetical protein PIB30_019554 [Stylosanthes scabra]|uniref:Uncharacterized protein n=1 Tax=Stylosanthes scabra TaxID=79078 RepID=A0ABU6X7D0_9FABA|nr:hypothetical protein [Stylosanthes scabra]
MAFDKVRDLCKSYGRDLEIAFTAQQPQISAPSFSYWVPPNNNHENSLKVVWDGSLSLVFFALGEAFLLVQQSIDGNKDADNDLILKTRDIIQLSSVISPPPPPSPIVAPLPPPAEQQQQAPPPQPQHHHHHHHNNNNKTGSKSRRGRWKRHQSGRASDLFTGGSSTAASRRSGPRTTSSLPILTSRSSTVEEGLRTVRFTPEQATTTRKIRVGLSNGLPRPA